MTPTVYFNGQLLPKDQVRISPDDRGFLFGDGIYEVVRSYEGKFFALEPHIDRLRYGLRETYLNGVDVDRLVDAVKELVRVNDLMRGDATVYVQVTRGTAPRTHHFPDPSVPPTVYAQAGRFTPKADPAVGAVTITVPDIRWTRCDIKTVQLLPNCMANQRAREAGAVEALFVRDGVVLEGSHTSVFFVLDGEVRTAPRTNYILPSITRATVLELCQESGIAVRETPVFQHELPRCSEMFLAGTTMEVMPIVRVDGAPVSKGTPGPVTKRLQALFCERARA
ncbi:MAG TPA: D-amino acid aminotransferase [Gemmatimonadales bacterium]|nr:D-amino acid aminotransferase [Gemmatimonadales bacterium]